MANHAPHLSHEYLLEALPYASILTDPEGAVIGWNERAERLFQWQAEDVLGRSIMEITVPEFSAAQATVIMAMLQLGQPWTGTFQVVRRDGTQFFARVQDMPLRDDDGEVVAILGICEEA